MAVSSKPLEKEGRRREEGGGIVCHYN